MGLRSSMALNISRCCKCNKIGVVSKNIDDDTINIDLEIKI